MKRLFENKENRIFISVIVITLIIASLPLFSKYCLTGHDSEYHLLRVEALKEGIIHGAPFLKINMLFFGGAGYASSMFYPDFLLYIPAALRAVGVSINFSWHMFIFICIALCFVSAFFSTLYITKNKYAALIGGILFTLCSYHLDDIYVRAAAGEYTAFIFLPVFLCGLYNICYEKISKPQLIVMSLAGVLLCHTLSFVLCIIITAVILFVNYKAFLEDKKLILKLIVSALVTIALTAYYLFPMLEQLMTDEFYVSNAWIDPSQEAMQATRVFDFLFPTAGVGLILFIIPRIIIKRNKDDKMLLFADECMAIGFIPMLISIDVFPWTRVDGIFSIIQFPWRLFLISSALFAMAGAIVMYRLGCYMCENISVKNNRFIEQLLTIIVLVFMTFTCFYSYTKQERTYYDFSLDYYSYKPFTANVIAGEWMPTRVMDTEKLIEQSEHAYSAEGEEVPFSRIKGTVRLCPKGVTSEYIDVPLIYYKGYAAKSDSGQTFKVDGGAENGLTRVYTDGCGDNITVYYKGTTVLLISRILSIVAAVCVAGLFIYRKKKVNVRMPA